MDFERLISTEKSTIAVKTIRKKCSVITFIFTLVVLVVLIIMFATTSHRLDSIESTLTRVDRTEQADVETLSHKLQRVEEEEVELLGVAPKLTTKPQPLRLIVEDSYYNLTCEATGSPLPNITWTRLVGSIPSSWDQQDGVLLIKGFKMHDSGNYYCKARNSLGEAIAHTTLNYMKKEAFKATFTTLGASGRFGPTHVGDHYNGQDHMGQVTVKKGIQIWVVPFTGRYEIQAVGASGGYDFRQDSKNYRGRGARMFGTFELRQGDLIHILVGHEGGCNFNRPYTSTAGGGGTFVSKGPSTPLIVAGGGGGYDSVSKRLVAIDASSKDIGKWAYGLGPGKNWKWKGGEDGLGAKTGLGTYTGGGGGGGGFYSSGGSSKAGAGGQGGDGFLQGGKGGQSRAFKVYGGFGGGGGADGGDASRRTNGGGGGGGGYSGGAPGANHANSCGGGGGSFNTGIYQRDYGAYNDKGHGYVIVTLV